MRLFSKIPIYFLLIFLLIACGGNDSADDSKEGLIQAKGDRYYGGVFRINESEYIKNLFPHNITDAYSYRVASQIYEGLFRFDPETLEVTNGLVESFEVNDSGTKYTFQLKKGVYFHDNPCFPGGKGREFKATDVQYSFKRL